MNYRDQYIEKVERENPSLSPSDREIALWVFDHPIQSQMYVWYLQWQIRFLRWFYQIEE